MATLKTFSDDVIPEVLEEAARSDAWSDGPEIQVPDQPLVLFDMGCTGTTVTPDDSFQVRIPSGRYLVRSLDFEIEDHAAFRLDRLVPAERS
ncbi:hypothetical protein ACFC00_43220 [Streptomyces adustus]|uniref:hypothetical protein n=1 Tax=Streptomyces adustus TaxID=1609272 RepID=UPI0035E07C55